jgi:small subunit ribosomal protein S1
VRNLVPFGAFVDLGGIEGLVHVSEMSRRRVSDPKEVVQVGQEVEVKVLKIEDGGKRISLSMRELEADPWSEIASRFAPGTQFTGTIARKTDFGLFVELEPGVDGLVHLSQLPIGMKMSDASLEIGATVTGWVREVDEEKRRLSLALREVAVGDPWENITSRYSLGQVVEGMVERVGPPGVFIQLEPGLTALLPMSELASRNDVHEAHQPGQKLPVKILSLDPERRRLTVSHEAAKEAAVRGEYLAYMSEKGNEGAGKSALAIALEKALGK